ncbi:MAG: thioesterase family protein [Rhizobiaceae bacterium]
MSHLNEVSRSFVNTWECDENDHLNVQFYLKRFDEAARVILALSANPAVPIGLPRTRHVRFHRELRPGTMIQTRSAMLNEGKFKGWLIHRLEDVGGERLSATAIDRYESQFDVPRIEGAEMQDALPRGLPGDDLVPAKPQSIIDAGGLNSNRSIVWPSECDISGHMTQQFYIARFTDAAPHVWETLGIGEHWLLERNLGRAAVEMKLTHHRPAKTGDVLFLYSKAEIAGRKTIKLRHELVRQTDMEPVASGEVLALILDLETRKSVELPADIMKR